MTFYRILDSNYTRYYIIHTRHFLDILLLFRNTGKLARSLKESSYWFLGKTTIIFKISTQKKNVLKSCGPIPVGKKVLLSPSLTKISNYYGIEKQKKRKIVSSNFLYHRVTGDTKKTVFNFLFDDIWPLRGLLPSNNSFNALKMVLYISFYIYLYVP